MGRIKYFIVMAINTVTGKCVVNLFGGTYLVAGNFVRRIR